MPSTALSSRASRVAVAVVVGVLAANVSPAMAAGLHSPSAGSPIGDWRTSTQGIAQTVSFTKTGQVYGDSGCNRFTGGYTVKGSQIFIGPLAATLMACPDAQMTAETQFLTALQSATNFRQTPKALRLVTPTTTVTLRPAS